jgi:hypothetical protein
MTVTTQLADPVTVMRGELRRLRGENAKMREWLTQFVTPPLAFAGKKATIEEVRLYLEKWSA